jgi:signal transduction histidine kinase
MISHKLVKEFGGQFIVNSIPGQGSIFKFTIQLDNDIDEDYSESNQILSIDKEDFKM